MASIDGLMETLSFMETVSSFFTLSRITGFFTRQIWVSCPQPFFWFQSLSVSLVWAKNSCLNHGIPFQSLAQRVKAFGPEEKETIKQWKKLNTEYNIAAMKYLQMDDHNMVKMLLWNDAFIWMVDWASCYLRLWSSSIGPNSSLPLMWRYLQSDKNESSQIPEFPKLSVQLYEA